MANAHDEIDKLINNNALKYAKGGIVHSDVTNVDSNKKYKDKKIDVVVEVPTPTEDKPGDTRLYTGSDIGWDYNLTESTALSRALEKSMVNSADSLSRGDFEELKNIQKQEIKKKKKRK